MSYNNINNGRFLRQLNKHVWTLLGSSSILELWKEGLHYAWDTGIVAKMRQVVSLIIMACCLCTIVSATREEVNALPVHYCRTELRSK